MLIDSMIIKLTRGGAGISPDYSLTIHGNGKVIYDGVENVKVKGIVESSIDKDKITSLLLGFKESDFFSLNDTYSVKDSITRPYTVISISMPKENGKVITKSVKYYHGDRNAPKELKALEDEIDEIVGSNKWISDLSEYEGFELKKESRTGINTPSHKKMSSESTNKKPIRLVAVGVSFIVVIVVILYTIDSGKYSQPEITNLTTASDIRGIRDYDSKTFFYRGEKIWVYQEYINITTIDNEACDIYINITVDNESGVIFHYDEVNKNETGNYGHAWWFIPEESWPLGIYYVTSYLVDNLSSEIASEKTVFVMI